VDSDDLSADIERQIQAGLEQASLILFVVDAQDGLVPLDREVARRLRPLGKPVLLVVNKSDSPRLESGAPEFFTLLKAPSICTSVTAERNREGLLSQIVRLLPEPTENELFEGEQGEADPELKLAIIGRRNVGKSTFINALAQTERMIVSEVAGTTRDSVDVRFELDGKAFVAIDTPGVRKKKSLANDIEFYSLTRSLRSVRRSNVVLMFLDASQTISMVDKQLMGEVSAEHKPCIFVVNKWDLGQEAGMTTEKWVQYIGYAFGSMHFCPVAFITARDPMSVKKLINLTQSVAKQARVRVPTARLNQLVRQAVIRNHPPMRANREAKIYYATQVATEPPTIVVKCNDPRVVDKSWRRYLLGVFHDQLPFAEVPIKVYYRSRSSGVGSADPEESLDEIPEIILPGDQPIDPSSRRLATATEEEDLEDLDPEEQDDEALPVSRRGRKPRRPAPVETADDAEFGEDMFPDEEFDVAEELGEGTEIDESAAEEELDDELDDEQADEELDDEFEDDELDDEFPDDTDDDRDAPPGKSPKDRRPSR
jgi:GTP-binding protein